MTKEPVTVGSGMGDDGLPFGGAEAVLCRERMKSCLGGFSPVDLKRLDGVKLMRRYDRKFIFHLDNLAAIVSFLRQNYRVLEIGGSRVFTYDNLYFDTGDRFFYHQHHNQRMNRYKLRCREYVDTGQCFFEVKFKDNRKQTSKSRFLLGHNALAGGLPERSRAFVREAVSANGGRFVDARLAPALRIRFNRVTFADLVRQERLTFDLNLTYTDTRSESRRVGNLVIAELKSESPSSGSPFFQYLKDMRVSPSGFSKYCMGIALMEKQVRCNRFKRRLSKLENLM